MTAIRALVADDSPTARRYLVEVLNDHPGVSVVGEAADGLQVVELTARLRPSVVVMDAVMPRLDGFAATERIMTETPTPVVIVTANLDPADVALALRSVEVGALAVLPKPGWQDGDTSRGYAAGFVRKIVTLSGVRVIRRYRTAGDRSVTAQPAVAPRLQARLVAVAASTGGPRALHDLLAGLPGDLPAPVVVVQHIADGFVDGLVRWLGGATALEVKVAGHAERLVPGCVYVAPDGRHLRVTSAGQVQLDDDPPIGGFRPAATALFESVAATYGASAAGIVLSGLGDDGLAGLLSLRAAGGQVLAQDEESSAVFGMPGVVVAAGIADTVGPVETIAARIREIVGGRTATWT